MVQIRNATPSDLKDIVDIYNSTVASRQVTADLEPVSVESRRNWFAAHTPEQYPLWVVQDNSRIAGWLSFSPFYGRPAYRHTAEVSIYLHPEYRRQGLGRVLLTEAIHHAPTLEFHTLLAFIFSHNTPSLNLFRSLGFEIHGELPNIAVLDDQERSLTLMGKRIQTPPAHNHTTEEPDSRSIVL
ncbi:GNAT family N-acetyltransferase [Deinococcus cellulosilyticus]|uniref:Phosphinothricin acetyltransferase n=1 Tax=Deinococcus cellulosilyticus (strain DSM 18568 / NBRC 106333 / KACC 11606 / 5516J-15) TaxID=1223518 RepID=A0A511N8Q8_DEIC1|nr:GNAT family N-acetyltransferase [Deinococcus cellulosilyticus]GEM49210.1 phosphinothricin acetyltransferase [Deinococcus cellulosilyticus NBRC 106333 = KACC 11606]